MNDVSMAGIVERLKSRRKELDMSFQDLAIAAGMSKSTLQRYESGAIKNIPLSRLETLAYALQTTPEYLMGWADDPLDYDRNNSGNSVPLSYIEACDGDYEKAFKLMQAADGDHKKETESLYNLLSQSEYKLVQKYRQLTPEGQKAADENIQTLLNLQNSLQSAFQESTATNMDISPDNVIPLRLSEQSASAGTGTYLGPECFKVIYTKKTDLTKKAKFGVPVYGNSMEPKFYDGDIIMISSDPVEIGDIGLFTLNGCGYVKMLGHGELISLNPDYDPIFLDDSIRCNGKVIGVLSPDLIVEK